MKKKRVRKPKDLHSPIGTRWACVAIRDGEMRVCTSCREMTEQNTRRLAAWLIRAAEYLEQEKDEEKRR